MGNHFKIIVPLYNVEKWIKYCIRSIKTQTHTDFECIIIDDISTDNSQELIKNEIKEDNRFRLIVNTEKKYALKNIHDALIECSPDDEDIVVTVDGDDWLANKDVLKTVNNIYQTNECWMTYGSYAEYPSKARGKFAKQIPQQVIDMNSFRRHKWCSSHLRTFKHHLWKSINKKDLVNPETGRFIKAAWDLAFMFPMLEMCGNKSHFIDKILYIYNRGNPLNEDKVNHSVQLNEERIVRNKELYNRIEN